MEDALKRLDKLTHEEAWMGIAQNLKATHAVGESVREVVEQVVAINNKVVAVDDRVAGVGDRVVSIDNTVKGVDAMVASVDDRVRVVNNRVTEVIHGAYIMFYQSPQLYLNNEPLRREGSEGGHATDSR